MSTSHVDKVASLIIPSGESESNALFCDDDYGDAAALMIMAPSTLDAGTYKFQVSPDASNWFDYQEGSPLADVSPPGIDSAAVYYGILAARFIRISGPEAADEREFLVTKHWTSP